MIVTLGLALIVTVMEGLPYLLLFAVAVAGVSALLLFAWATK